MDGGVDQAQPALVNLGRAIRAQLGDINQAELARRLDINSGHLTRIIKGEVPGLAIEMVLRIERELGLNQGDLFRAAGLAAGDVTVSDAIAADGRLRPEDKHNLLYTYEVMAGRAVP